MFPFSFPIAIKSPHMTEQEGIKLCVDEAKSMTKIGAYHDHIVNLQGVSYIYDSVEKQFSQVSSRSPIKFVNV